MKTKTVEYQSISQLEYFIDGSNISNKDTVLIQIFTSQNDENFIINLRDTILNKLPNAKILGSTTCGEISQNGALKDSTVISFSTFHSTVIETKLINYETSSYQTGQNMIKSFDNYLDTNFKLLITFADGLGTNGEEYLNGISSINNNIVVSGGMAGDNAKFEETFIFTELDITNHGSVGAAFYNSDLNIFTDYSFNWESVGKKHIVEKSEQNRVYTISGMTTVDFYKYYLGDDTARMLPALGIEFPLVMKENGISIGRAVLAKHDDGSLSFAGNIPQGSVVQFGHGDVQMIINKGLNNVKRIVDNPVESIFIYSCMARHALLKDDINLEILPLKELAPISGFFTYGEFYNDCSSETCSNQLLNQTMTILSISESNQPIDNISPNIFSHNPPRVDDMSLHRTQALSILIEQTTKELEDLNDNLEEQVKKEVAKNIEKDSMMQMMQAQAQLGDMIEMILHQWRQPLSAITTTISSAQVYKMTDMLTDDILDNTFGDVIKYIDHLNDTVDDFRDLFKVSTKFTSIKPNDLINKSLTIINPLIKIHKIKVINEFNSDSKVSIPVNLLMQVILNIVKNAIDILIEKQIENPTIKFKTYIKKERCVIKIMDNAGGIPEDILPYIFDKKFTTKADSHGTGIGLDMSKTIIESKVGGKLTVNNVGEWAVFNIKIPLI